MVTIVTNGLRAGNLPAETTRLVGRRRELARIRELCGEARLVTVTGVAGVGKTRLALRAAAELGGAFADGAWLVELSPLTDAAALPYAIAEALPLADQSTRPVLDVVADYLADRELLLVLDTCEHLADPCAMTVAALLAAAPKLRVLATSRRRLRLAAERVYPVEPLPVPCTGAAAGDDDVVALLADRAARVTSGLDVTGRDRDDAVRLCRRLDGLPLAVELAAARLRDLPLPALIERLDDRFAVLGDVESEASDADPPWHQALSTAIGWSHELCTADQRLAWARLSVFAGGFDIEAAREVCADERLPGDTIDALVGALADASILGRDDGGRYRMLDTIRAYGAVWLRRLGEDDRQRRRHRDHFLALARRGEAVWMGADLYAWNDRMKAELENLRAALDFSLSHPEGHVALELAGSLWFCWYGYGLIREGRYYLDRALAADTAASPARALALWIGGLIALAQGDPEVAVAREEEYARLSERYDDAEGVEAAQPLILAAGLIQGDQDSALALGKRLLDNDDPDRRPTIAYFFSSILVAVSSTLTGRYDEAVAVIARISDACERHGNHWMRSHLDIFRAQAELGRGRPEAATAYARDALGVKHRLGDRVLVAIALDTLGPASLALGDPDHVAFLLGLADQAWETVGRRQLGMPGWIAARETCEKTTRTTLGDPAYQASYEEGHTINLNTGITRALTGPS